MTAAAPLLDWPVQKEIERIAADRAALIDRIAALRPHEAKKLELRGRLMALTEMQLRLEATLRQ